MNAKSGVIFAKYNDVLVIGGNCKKISHEYYVNAFEW